MFLWPLCWWQGKAEPGVFTRAVSDTGSPGLRGTLHRITVSCSFLSRTGSGGGQHRLCSGSKASIPGHLGKGCPRALLVWLCARDRILQVREAEEAISNAAVLSRSLTIQMCSFEYDHQLKALNRSGVQWCCLAPS